MPPGSVFLDVGANVGAYIRKARQVLDARRIYAFEPQAELVSELRKRYPGVTIEALALSAHPGSARFKVPEVKGELYRSRGTLAEFTERGETGARYFDVLCMTLDAYVAERHCIPGLIKIDVEGHEEAVLEGAVRTLAEHHPPIIIEIEQRQLNHPVADIFNQLTASGYALYFFDSAEGAYVPISRFTLAQHQDPTLFKTPAYVNNFLCLPPGMEAPRL
jgi:FkbM family methyltransferase